MAERRMFAKSIVLSDAFLDMPLSARCLYFTLGMLADDDGFVGNPKSIIRQCGASEDDLKVLISKKFVLWFETGVIIIKHWRMNNYLRNDRHHSTTYIEEMNGIGIDSKGAYTTNPSKMVDGIPSGNQVTTNGIPNGNQLETEVSIGKDSIDKYSKYSCAFSEFWKNYPRKKEKSKAYKCYLARLNDGYSEDELLAACINYAAECEHNKTDERYIKLGATFLSINEPFRDYLKGEDIGQRVESDPRESEEQRKRELDEIRRRIESGEDDGLWD